MIAPWSDYQPQSFRTDDFAAYYRRVKASLEQAVSLDQAVQRLPRSQALLRGVPLAGTM